MLDGASGLDNVIASTSVAVANFENASNRNKALNQVLRFINIPPVSSITASDTSYTADKLLSELEKIVQAEGWHFNTERDFTLTRDGNSQIDLSQVALPVLHVDADKYQDHKHNIVVRDGKLWDVNKSTSIFGSDVKVELVLQQTWDNIPVPIQRYIIARTAKELSATMGRADAVQALAVEENRAKVEATQYDEEQGDYSIFDSYDVARVLDRSIGYSNTTL
jgi:hypothetical protein